ncbi:MAG: UDP-N-acetylmuramate dehydrogenase [Myxococcota bacterium]
MMVTLAMRPPRGRITSREEADLTDRTEWAAALVDAGVPVKLDEPLVKKTWWRVGGPAEAYAEIGSSEGLATALRVTHAHDVPVFALGNASNLLIGDGGIAGLVVRLTGALAGLDAPEPGRLELGGGLKMVSLLRTAQREGYTGLEMVAGVPGTIGGGVRMNAGTRLGELGERIVSVEVVRRDGHAETWGRAELDFGYRHCALPADAIVTKARVQLADLDPEESRAHIAEHLDYRARTQPTDVPTCGSTFRNPEGDSAGRLIEAAGLKGLAVGNARVSEKHANFLVNEGGATAADLRRLIESIQARVRDQFGVELRREVHYAGTFPGFDGRGV